MRPIRCSFYYFLIALSFAKLSASKRLASVDGKRSTCEEAGTSRSAFGGVGYIDLLVLSAFSLVLFYSSCLELLLVFCCGNSFLTVLGSGCLFMTWSVLPGGGDTSIDCFFGFFLTLILLRISKPTFSTFLGSGTVATLGKLGYGSIESAISILFCLSAARAYSSADCSPDGSNLIILRLLNPMLFVAVF